MSDSKTVDAAAPATHIAELLQAIGKALRAMTLYLPNNPMYQRAVDAVRERFAPIWRATDVLELEVREAELAWDGDVVYAVEQKSESLAWTLHKDGLRTLTFLPGVEEEEILRWLRVLVRVRNLSADAGDDLLTLLWEEEFDHLLYTFSDLLTEGAAPPVPEQEGPAVTGELAQQGVREEAPPRPAGAISIDDFDSTLYFLEEGEIARLQQVLEQEYQRDLRQNVLAAVFDVLEFQDSNSVRTEVVTIVADFLPYLLAWGDYRSVAYVLRESRTVLGRLGDLDPALVAQLRELPARLSNPESISQLLQALDGSLVPPSEEELGELFAEITAEALPTLLTWMGQLETPAVREAVEGAISRLAERRPAAVLAALSSEETVVAAYAAHLAGRLRLGTAVGPLGAMLERPDPELRRAAVEALAAVGSPGALQALIAALRDSSRDVRLVAVRALGQRRFRNALPAIATAISGKTIREADLTEKMAFFEAYGLIGGASVVGALRPTLLGKGLFRRRADPETRACAALALGKTGASDARTALEQARDDKEVLVRNAVAQALREGEL